MTETRAPTDYLMLIWADGMPTPEELVILQREIPAWVRETDGRGLRRLGRELDPPETAVTVRVRNGETVVSDGAFTETKEFIAGFNLLSCTDLDEALSVAAECPISWIQTLELAPLRAALRCGRRAAAFARSDDGERAPFLLTMWAETPLTVAEWDDDSDTWLAGVQAEGKSILGGSLQGPEAARTVRVRDGRTDVGDGPHTGGERFIAGIEVVACADRAEAVALAADHPFARGHAIEVRPFYRQ